MTSPALAPPALQELIVTSGWHVVYHRFRAVDAPAVLGVDGMNFFKQDLYQARHQRFDRLIDLGWYPEFDLKKGHYSLVLYAGDLRGELLRQVQTPDRRRIVDTMNEWFAAVTDGGP